MRTDRRSDLDAIRAVAAALVAASHWFAGSALANSFVWGRAGVVAFFVLSGFFIGRLLEAAEGAPGATPIGVVLSFGANRLLRIVPPYAALIAVVAFAGYPWVRAHPGALFGFTVNFDLARGAVYGYAVHLWTISVEVQFYALWAIAFVATPRRRRPVLIGAAFIIGVGWRLAAASLGMDWVVISYLLPGCLNSFAIGLWLVAPAPVRHPWAIAAVAAVLLAGLAATFAAYPMAVRLTDPLYVTAQDLLVAVVTAGVMLGMDRTPAIRRSAVVVYLLGPLGLISYGFYLWHYFAEPAVAALGWSVVSPLAKGFTYTAFTLLAATVSWFAVERPSQALRRRLRRNIAAMPVEVSRAR